MGFRFISVLLAAFVSCQSLNQPHSADGLGVPDPVLLGDLGEGEAFDSAGTAENMSAQFNEALIALLPENPTETDKLIGSAEWLKPFDFSGVSFDRWNGQPRTCTLIHPQAIVMFLIGPIDSKNDRERFVHSG